MGQRDFALRWIKRGLAAPFVLLGGAIATWGSLDGSPSIWAVALVLVAVGVTCLPQVEPNRITAQGWAVVAFAALIVLSNTFVTPGYTAAAPFHAAFLIMGFLIGTRMRGDTAYPVVGALALGIGVLALASIWQVAVRGEGRATAWFETPATLATVLNFALLPVLVLLAYGRAPWRWLFPGFVLAAGLACSGSRGGLLGLMAGCFIAVLFARRGGYGLAPHRAFLVVAVLAAGFALPILAQKSAAPQGAAAPRALLGEQARESSVSRLELYALAVETAQAHPVTGVGYLGFRPVLDANRARVPTYVDGDTYFVHNDYLQVLLELGVPGLAALAVLVLAPFVAAWRLPAVAGADRLLIVAMLAAAGSMVAHALVDFPFYVPVCLLLFGLVVGVLGRGAIGSAPSAQESRPVALRWARIGVATLGIVLLAPPVIAEAAAGQAHKAWRNSDGQGAAYWYEVARRFEPRDWRYHLYIGQFWFAQAAETGKPDAAKLADEAFAAGFEANPVEVRNLLGRISLHRQFPGLLATPAGPDTMKQWLARASTIAPFHPGVRSEQARFEAAGKS